MTIYQPEYPVTQYATVPGEAELHAAIAQAVSWGYNVQSISTGIAVLTHQKKLNWLLHVILALLTGGFWLIVPLLILMVRRPRRLTLTVDHVNRVIRWN